MTKKFILIIIIAVLSGTGIYYGFFRKEKVTFSLAEVVRGDIVQEVSETGKVVKGEETTLSFKTSGRIEKIYVKVGNEVKSGDILAELDTENLEIQVQEAKAAVLVAQAKLNKLLAGSGAEEIRIAETGLNNAKVALQSAQQNLKDVQALAEENLRSDYGDAQNYLDDAYLKSYNAFNAVDLIHRSYFISNDQESLRVKENKNIIGNALIKIRNSLENAKKTNSSQEAIDAALLETKEALEKISSALKIVRENCEEPIYRSAVSATDKTSLDTHRANIITALTNVVNSQQAISETKLTNQSNINTAQATLEVKHGQLKAAEDELAKILAPARKEDIDLSEAQLSQARAAVALLENQIKEAVLKSPVSGQITDVKKRAGEIVAQDAVISLLPSTPFEVKVDIYEEDVVKVIVGQDVNISLISFPGKIFRGKVLSITPAEKIIEGVVYYEVIISFEDLTEEIRPGMSADVVIITAKKENVLIIPEGAIREKEGKTCVQVSANGEPEGREIELGLAGSDDMVEVVFGLNEGDKVIID